MTLTCGQRFVDEEGEVADGAGEAGQGLVAPLLGRRGVEKRSQVDLEVGARAIAEVEGAESVGVKLADESNDCAADPHRRGAAGVQQRVARGLVLRRCAEGREEGVEEALRVVEVDDPRFLAAPVGVAPLPCDGAPNGLPLIGEVARARDVDAAHLEQAEYTVLMARVRRERLQHSAAEAPSQLGLLAR